MVSTWASNFNLRRYATVPAISPAQYPAYSLGTNLATTSSAGSRKMLESATYDVYDASIGEHLMDPYPKTTGAVVGRCTLSTKPQTLHPKPSALHWPLIPC
jgi:hypothetical protein